jgi:electron transport complex protein RnfD
MGKKIDNEKLIISGSPHLLKKDSIKSIIWLVVYSLLSVVVYGVYSFGFLSLIVILISIAISTLTEIVCLRMRKKPITLTDGSAVLTGLLLGLSMPPTVPLYIPVISSIFAIGLVKQSFGGLGENWANPAIAGRLFAFIAWPEKMNRWIMPFTGKFQSYDTITSSTPLGILKSNLLESYKIEQISSYPDNIFDFFNNIFSGPMELINNSLGTNLNYLDLFFGLKPGSIGEISIFLIIVGALLLIFKKIISIEIPLVFIGTVMICTWIFGGLQFGKGYFQGDFLFHILTGSVVLGAFYMATDVVTTPITFYGRLIFALGCGIITSLVRLTGYYPEGVSFAILFMNMMTPMINKIIKLKPSN